MLPSDWRSTFSRPGTRVVLAAIFFVSIAGLLANNSALFTPLQTQDVISPPVVTAPVHLTPIVFALVMFGKDSALEGVVAVKTALMHISRPAEFHIMCSPEVLPIVESKFKLFSRPTNDVRVHFYVMESERFQQRAVRAGIADWGWGGFLKLFMHEVLLDVERVIYFDTDMMFLVDPFILWREFDNMADDQIVSFPTVGPKSDGGNICSCVMLLKLAQMRDRPFMTSTLFQDEVNARALGTNETWNMVKINPKEPPYGDQGLYWAIWKQYPQYFMHLSETWDISLCRQFWNTRLDLGEESMTEDELAKYLLENHDFEGIPERYPTIFPGIVHYNCLPDDGPTWYNPIIAGMAYWAPYVSIAREYKWIWLNRGDGSSEVTVSIKENPPFYDELAAQETPRIPSIPTATRFLERKRHPQPPH